MAAFVCRMCGGVLERKGSGVCRCEYCGNMQSVPLIDDEDKAELCIVAEGFRREYQYDKAIEIYEQLLKVYPTDADLYWSMLLCRYGVECKEQQYSLNRTHPRSLLSDEDYKAALKYATSEQRAVMESQAAQIDSIRRSIVEAASGFKQYDVYLCCKEADKNGRRTKDSVIAADIFKKLTEDGLKVFFPQVTLEDTLSSEQEQHIYAALNSSRVMVIVGIGNDSFESLWVKNAWVRFISLMNGERKAVIPVFKDADASKLPSGLAQFQALDMARLGFERDLISSIRAIIAVDTASVKVVSSVKDDPMLRRAYVHLEYSEFDDATRLCDEMLKTQGDAAEIYLVKLLIEYRVSSEKELDKLEIDFSGSENYRRAMQLGDEGFRINLREHNDRSIYNKFSALLDAASTEAECRAVADGFRSLGDYLDSAKKAEEAREKLGNVERIAQQNRREGIYALCVKRLAESTDLNILRSVERSLNDLGDYKDAVALKDKCTALINEISVNGVHSVDIDADDGERVVRKDFTLIKRIAIAAAAVCGLAVVTVAGVAVFGNKKDDIRPIMSSEVNISSEADSSDVSSDVISSEKEEKYRAALALLKNQDYDEAIKAFSLLGDYEDSADRVLEAKYQKADKLLAEGDYKNAELIFTVLGSYSDSADRIDDCRCARGVALFEKGELEAAESIFLEIQQFDKLSEVRYEMAGIALESGNRERAKELYNKLGSYRDSYQHYGALVYEDAEQLVENGDTENAKALYNKIGDYSDARQKYCALVYADAEKLVNSGKYSEASSVLSGISDYPDVAQLLNLCKYNIAQQYADAEDYENAIKLYSEIEDYSDAATQLWRARYSYAKKLSAYGRYDEAMALADMLGDSEEAQSLRLFIRIDELYLNDTITFGRYEQDGDTTNGSEPINWLVIGSDIDDGILLISEKMLDVKSFGTLSWDDCPLRSWLNNEFYNSAFNSIEKEFMNVHSYYPSEMHTSGILRLLQSRRDMDEYSDKVFVPQTAYIDFYMDEDQVFAAPTEAVQQKLNASSSPAEWWCISEIGMIAYSVDADGNYIQRIKNNDCKMALGVRPVIVISNVQ